MAKWYGVVGYGETVETVPGVWELDITEYNYSGDVLANNRRLQATSNLNDDISISNKISILTDPEVYKSFHLIRYLEFMGTKWKVTSVEPQYPRLILTLGGVYNGN